MKWSFLFLAIIITCHYSCTSTRNQTASSLGTLLSQHQIDSTNFEIFLRAFKREQRLEVWIKNRSDKQFKHFTNYAFCTTSGTLGPKRQEGDLQIPEGCYFIDRFNPNSSFYLSLGLNYPNDSDRILGHPTSPGSDIFIHGGCASVGCIPITNAKIETLYGLASRAKNQGQSKIMVHIFPSDKMEKLISKATQHRAFWNTLLPIFQHFETQHTIPKVWVKPNGAYALAS